MRASLLSAQSGTIQEYNFGRVAVGQSASLDVAIRNVTSESMDTSDFYTTTLEFEVVPGNCPSSPEAGKNCLIQVVFKPIAARLVSGRVIGETFSAKLEGEGIVGGDFRWPFQTRRTRGGAGPLRFWIGGGGECFGRCVHPRVQFGGHCANRAGNGIRRPVRFDFQSVPAKRCGKFQLCSRSSLSADGAGAC